MFEGKDHLHAIASAIGTLGGFTPAPVWFRTVVNNSICQIVLIAIWIFQSGGRQDFPYSLVVALLFYSLIESTRYLAFSKPKVASPSDYKDEEPFLIRSKQ